MSTLLLFARLVLAAIFVVAGAAKLSDLSGTREAIAGFGIPRRFATPLAWLLPISELLVAGALLPASTAWLGAAGSLILLVAFSAGIANVVARGRQTECHCFGQLHSARVSWKTFARNILLAVVAGFVLVAARNGIAPSYLDSLQRFNAIEIFTASTMVIALTLFAVIGWFMLHLLRQQGRLLVRLDKLQKDLESRSPSAARVAANGLAVGTRGPFFEIPDIRGIKTTLTDLLSPLSPLMLIFSHPQCSPCGRMFPEIAQWQNDYAGKLKIAVISGSTVEDNRDASTKYGIATILIQHEMEVADAYQSYATPSAIILSPEGVIVSTVAQGRDEIRLLLDSFMSSTRASPTSLLLNPNDAGNGLHHAVSLDVH